MQATAIQSTTTTTATTPINTAPSGAPALPRTIVNPIIGDRVTFVRTAAETGGEYLLAELELAPKGRGTTPHRHRAFVETFEVLEGRLNVNVDGREQVLQPGDRAAVPVGAAHRFYNATDEVVRFRVEIRPPGRFEEVLRIAYGLARDGLTAGNGRPKSLLQAAYVFAMADTYLASAPVLVQHAIFTPLAVLARWWGVDRTLQKYLSAS